MKPIRSMKCYHTKNLPPLHLLFTEEDGVIVVRCLEFSISSHGETIQEALESINSAMEEYIRHGLENNDIQGLFDPELKEYWDLYHELELEKERQRVNHYIQEVKEKVLSKGFNYAES